MPASSSEETPATSVCREHTEGCHGREERSARGAGGGRQEPALPRGMLRHGCSCREGRRLQSAVA